MQLPEGVGRADAHLQDCVGRYGHGHARTQKAIHTLATGILEHLQRRPHEEHLHDERLLDLLWKKCQHGPFDHHRRLAHTAGGADCETCLHVAIGYQVAAMSALGGLHGELLHELHLPCSRADGGLSMDRAVGAKNAIHLGDLFRYKASYQRDLWSSAMLCYRFAVRWQPECGLAWNQIGVLLSCREGCVGAAVFHFVKALAAEEPFLTARKNLIGCLRTATRDPFMEEVYQHFASGARITCQPRHLDEQQQFISDYIDRQ